MSKKYNIQVVNKDSILIKEIKRVLRSENIGNFNPIFCRYNGKRCLVQSLGGDISDPFRRDEGYFNTLYIEIEGGKK